MKGGYDGVLNEGDIEFMKNSQDEIYTLRERPIDVIYVEKTYDEFTGQLIGEEEKAQEVNAVITEITIRSKDGARYIEDGIEYEQGDIKIDVKIDNIADTKDDIIRAEFNGRKYERSEERRVGKDGRTQETHG